MLEAKSAVSSDEPVFAQRSDPSRDPRRSAKKPVCIVLHQEKSNPGHVGQWFVPQRLQRSTSASRASAIRCRRRWSTTAAAVVFGGPMSANDKDEFIARETEWIGVALKEEKPFLGICLGAQMLANHLGAKVGFHAEELAEIGYYPLLTTTERHPPGALSRARLPVASRRLRAGARSAAACHIHRRLPQPGLRLRLGGIGVQFHPEITYAQVHRWTGRQQHAARHEGRPRAPRAHRGPHPSRAQGARLARPLPRPLGRGRTYD